MPVLSTLQTYFGFGTEDTTPALTLPPTLDEKLGAAAADRGFAFDLLEQAEEALADAAQAEAEVAEESLRRASRGLEEARLSAERILLNGQVNAARYEDQAYAAQRNALDDSSAASALRALVEQDVER